MNTTLDWRPTATRETLEARAKILAAIRTFFAARGVLEVETPLLSSATATAPHLDSFKTYYTGPGAVAPGVLPPATLVRPCTSADGLELYLHTSPEFAMKRLLAAGSGPIYQICKVFRNGERGRIHNPEFTMLEWYRPGFDHQALMNETEELVTDLLSEAALREPSERLTYAEAFARYAEVNPLAASMKELCDCVRAHGIEHVTGLAMDDRDGWLDLLLTHVVGPKLGQQRLCFLYDYPASQAALARIRPGSPAQPYPVAERFELYVNGVELASGYHELGDGVEQRRRFEADIKKRAELRTKLVPMDERLLAALESGLPDCAGVAVGVDRLVMLATGIADIDEVVSFPLDRA
ncbi:MAG TPA: EF-P lysine aminoacylase EpmA [Gammaproteobacteria bacterium]|nr:EF-P lysine aminoacylase EpmA [Gammaproteobacteria bacterium]